MSKPRYRWWPYVKNVIRAYPELKRIAETPPQMSMTAAYGPQMPRSGAGRALEAAVVKRLSRRDAAEYEAVSHAIRDTARMKNGKERLQIIELVYWKRSHTLAGAGYVVGYSYGHAKRIQEAFICAVAKELGLKEKDEPQEPKT